MSWSLEKSSALNIPSPTSNRDDTEVTLAKRTYSEIDTLSAINSEIIGKPEVDIELVNLMDKKYRTDAKPLTPDCTCLACRSHSRAYIHHLMIAHELLAEILIYTHNQHQLCELMSHLRMSKGK